MNKKIVTIHASMYIAGPVQIRLDLDEVDNPMGELQIRLASDPVFNHFSGLVVGLDKDATVDDAIPPQVAEAIGKLAYSALIRWVQQQLPTLMREKGEGQITVTQRMGKA